MNTNPTPFEFLAYMVENYKTEISMNRDYTECLVKDWEDFRNTANEMRVTDFVLKPTYAIGVDNESGDLFVKLEDIKFYITYHDMEEKEKLVHDFELYKESNQ